MTDTIEVLGNLGEFLGAIAVFATLAYLAIQIRQSSNAQRAAAYDSAIQTFIDVRKAGFEDAEMMEIYVKATKDPESLDEIERLRYRLFLYNVMLSFWHIHSQPADLKEELWEAQTAAIQRAISNPGGRWFWNEYKGEFVRSFQIEIDRLIAENESPRGDA